jgi:hypothetical protein
MRVKVMFGNGGEEKVLCDGAEIKNRIRKFRSFVEVME